MQFISMDFFSNGNKYMDTIYNKLLFSGVIRHYLLVGDFNAQGRDG